MKSYTDLEQSKKLAEILPLESADMCWIGIDDDESFNGSWEVVPKNSSIIATDDKSLFCWSLAALLDIIPKQLKGYNVLRIDITSKDFAIWYDDIGSKCGVNNELPNVTKEYAVDACYEMIIKLKERNLL